MFVAHHLVRRSAAPHGVSKVLASARALLVTAALTVAASTANAGITIPGAPLQANAGVPANVMFILDDSGSMASDFMPDALPATTTINVASQAFTRNTIYYNPSVVYRPWRQADGTYMADASYGAASDHDTHLLSNIDLGSANRTFYVPLSASDPADGTKYTRYRLRSDGTADACLWTAGPPAGYNACSTVSSFTWPALDPVDPPVVRTLAQEKQNFANWYTYHRTRSKAAKAGASSAFNEIGTDIRVGFTTIWDRGTFRIPVATDNGLFDDIGANTNRSTWFGRLFDATASGTTPLKVALNRAGQYFSESGASSPYGPDPTATQITCRQNFAILTTDGYSNEGAFATLNYDGTASGTITGPAGRTYTYNPALPYSDGVSGTLADIAMRYWKSDLRTDLVNNVPTSGADPAFWQHMVTFGLSIGLKGNLDPKTDLPNIISGAKTWPNPPLNNHISALDDFWHASINGHGDFVAASSPQEFTDGLKGALAAILSRTRSNANVAVTATRITGGTRVFEPSYNTGLWTGEIKAFPVTSSGVGTTPVWLASDGIPSHAGRSIYAWDGTGGTAFSWAALTPAQQAAFGAVEIFDYVRGDDSNEQRNGGTLRDRTTKLGDVVHSSPVYEPDTGTLYFGANDGMLHAVDALTGAERFAYVPGGVDYSELATLADRDYAHKFFVDGELAISTVLQTPGKRILVGLLGRGGRAGSPTVYALDVTDPTSFNASDVLWEFQDPDLVNALGRPLITKLNNGETGVIIGNGYNSSTDRSALFVLNVETGALLSKIDTGQGSAATPNGMATPKGWDYDRNGTVDLVYAGDLLGNVWRFNLSSNDPNVWDDAGSRFVLHVARDAGGNRQPITGAMSIGLHPLTFERWVFFGTGRYLSATDPPSKAVQSWYGLIDRSATIANRTPLRQRTITTETTIAGRTVRTFSTATAGDMIGKQGWYLDLLTPPYPPGTPEGERMVTDSILFGGILLASSIIPTASLCDADVKGFVNAIDPFTGANLTVPYFDSNGDGSVDANDVVSTPGGPVPAGSIDLGGGFTTNPVVVDNVLLAGGIVKSVNVADPSYAGRISWRELIRR
jgi:type IV pilus assembly protein PilY1